MAPPPSASLDPLVFGHRLRHLRRQAGLTLDALGQAVGRPASYLSQLENGHREPRLSTVNALAGALGVAPAELLSSAAPNRRAELEVALAHMQADPRYRELQLPYLRPSARLDDAALEHVVSLFDRVRALSERVPAAPVPSPLPAGPANGSGVGARAANAAMRDEMRKRDNYFEEIER
ncbi:MAG TPA: helix-turn-helix transcriptional regulator, partial [Acidimicrobiales bacterium]|nr:helix-turn-helix transcriptional regulator [Acidimicrobiales bacterium]